MSLADRTLLRIGLLFGAASSVDLAHGEFWFPPKK